MKKTIVLLLAMLLCLSVGLLAACNNESEPELLEISGVKFDNASYDYDGTEKSIVVSGTLPTGANVEYKNNKATDVGVYNATATVTAEGYKTLTLNATLTINGLDFTGITFENATFDYDGTEKSIVVSGTLPQGATVEYKNNKATDTGEYKATATITAKGYNTLTLNATLKINGLNFTGITFENATFDYDGTEKSIAVSGTLPTGATVDYKDNKGTDAGKYKATAVVTATGYNALTLNATLTINKIDIVGVEFNGATYEYDSLEHSIAIEGNVPAGAIVKYYYQGEEISSPTFVEVGEYEIKVTISGKNYNTFETRATLKIKSTEELLYSVNHNGTIYFQNNLDGNTLYSYKSGTLAKVNKDNAQYLVSDGTNAYYTSSSLFGGSIKQLNAGVASPLYNVTGEYLASDGTYIYYAVNNLLMNTDQNGIYKYKIDATEDEAAVKICTDKAKYLVVVGDYVYYANASDGNKLCKVSTTANAATGTVLWDEKVEYLITDNTNLYFNSSNGLVGGKAIRKYVISSDTCIKLTVDAGKYLTKIGSYIYYINNDLLTSNLFGDGIYRVSVSTNVDVNTAGTKLLSAGDNNGYSSLMSDGTDLYYYKLNDKHFYRYSIQNETETDLLDGFVVQDTTTFVGGANIAEYKGEIYYTNIRDNGYLYKYNPTTRLNVKVLDEQVSGVYFYNDKMYYSTYVLTNYAFWRMDLNTFAKEKVSSNRLDKIIFDNDKMYFLKVGGAYNNYIYEVSLEALDSLTNYKNFMDIATKLYDVTMWVNDFYKVGDYLYCASNAGLLGKDDYLHTYCISTKTATKSTFETTAFTVAENGVVYFYDSNDKTLSSFDGTTAKALVTKVDVTDLIVHDGKIYYSSSSDTNQGLFVYDIASGTNTKISGRNAHALTVINGNIYFMQTAITYSNDIPSPSSENGNTAKLCRYNGTTVEVLAG